MDISAARPAELVEVLAKTWPAGVSVKEVTNLIAKALSRLLAREGYPPIKPSRVYDIWGGEATPRYWEMDALREAAGMAVAREAHNEFRTFSARLDRVEHLAEQVLRAQEAILVPDEDVVRPDIDAVDVVRSGRHRAVDRRGAAR